MAQLSVGSVDFHVWFCARPVALNIVQATKQIKETQRTQPIVDASSLANLLLSI